MSSNGVTPPDVCRVKFSSTDMHLLDAFYAYFGYSYLQVGKGFAVPRDTANIMERQVDEFNRQVAEGPTIQITVGEVTGHAETNS